MEFYNYLGNTITNDARRTREMKSRIAVAKAALNNKKVPFTSKLNLNVRNKLVKCYIWGMALTGAEKRTLRKVGQKYLESFEKWCWRRMEMISWADRLRNEIFERVKEERNNLHKIHWRKVWSHSAWSCLLKRVTQGKIEGRIKVTGKRG